MGLGRAVLSKRRLLPVPGMRTAGIDDNLACPAGAPNRPCPCLFRPAAYGRIVSDQWPGAGYGSTLAAGAGRRPSGDSLAPNPPKLVGYLREAVSRWDRNDRVYRMETLLS